MLRSILLKCVSLSNSSCSELLIEALPRSTLELTTFQSTMHEFDPIENTLEEKQNTPSFYFKIGEMYPSRTCAFEALGCNVRCKGHAARVVKKNGPFTYLHCHLRDSFPKCPWAAMLRELPDG